MAQTNEMRFGGSQLDTERMFKSNEGLASKEAVLYKVNSNDLYAMFRPMDLASLLLRTQKEVGSDRRRSLPPRVNLSWAPPVVRS